MSLAVEILPEAPPSPAPEEEIPQPAPTTATRSDSGLEPGFIVNNQWRLLERVGRGAFGDIFIAEAVKPSEPLKNLLASKNLQAIPDDSLMAPLLQANSAFGPPIALKIEKLSPDSEEPAKTRAVLKLEAIILSKLQKPTPAVARFIEFGRDFNAGIAYLGMELLGENLLKLRRKRSNGKFSLSTILRFGLQAIKSIQAIHSIGFIHRDIKPSNFCIGPPGVPEKRRIFLIDFGLARYFLDRQTGKPLPARENITGFRGTPRYASIFVHREEDLSRRDDFWSLLYILIEFYTGDLPWGNKRDKLSIGRVKERYFTPQRLLKGCPSCFYSFMELLLLQSFDSQPPYEEFYHILEEKYKELQEEPDFPYDWEEIPAATTTLDGSSCGVAVESEKSLENSAAAVPNASRRLTAGSPIGNVEKQQEKENLVEFSNSPPPAQVHSTTDHDGNAVVPFSPPLSSQQKSPEAPVANGLATPTKRAEAARPISPSSPGSSGTGHNGSSPGNSGPPSPSPLPFPALPAAPHSNSDWPSVGSQCTGDFIPALRRLSTGALNDFAIEGFEAPQQLNIPGSPVGTGEFLPVRPSPVREATEEEDFESRSAESFQLALSPGKPIEELEVSVQKSASAIKLEAIPESREPQTAEISTLETSAAVAPFPFQENAARLKALMVELDGMDRDLYPSTAPTPPAAPQQENTAIPSNLVSSPTRAERTEDFNRPSPLKKPIGVNDAISSGLSANLSALTTIRPLAATLAKNHQAQEIPQLSPQKAGLQNMENSQASPMRPIRPSKPPGEAPKYNKLEGGAATRFHRRFVPAKKISSQESSEQQQN